MLINSDAVQQILKSKEYKDIDVQLLHIGDLQARLHDVHSIECLPKQERFAPSLLFEIYERC